MVAGDERGQRRRGAGGKGWVRLAGSGRDGERFFVLNFEFLFIYLI